MDWNDVRHFLALARLGSVRAAGASLGVSHSTVARRVESLEARLTARLFDRNRDGYTLTEAGQQMLPGAERVEREMAALERGLLGQDERLAGRVSLTCCDDYVSEILVRELSTFCATYPGIELGMTTDSRPFDLSKREADIAVRTLAVGIQPPEHLIGTRLVPLHVASYVSTLHASRIDPDLGAVGSRWVSFDDRKIMGAMVAGSSHPDRPLWGAFASLPLLVHAAREGLGMVMLPTYVGDGQPGLSRMARPDLRHMADVWLLSHLDLRDNARFRATRAAVATALRKHMPLFRGEADGCCTAVS
jgi:DNA-binding transcriptional LysR family regulator